MPEGPSILILKEKLLPFKGKRVIDANGYAKDFDADKLIGKTLKDIKTWGKQTLLCFPKFTVRVHMMLFGSYLINERPKKNASLHLQFANGEVNFSISSIKLIEQPLDELYDWSADIMSFLIFTPSVASVSAISMLRTAPFLYKLGYNLNSIRFKVSGLLFV